MKIIILYQGGDEVVNFLKFLLKKIIPLKLIYYAKNILHSHKKAPIFDDFEFLGYVAKKKYGIDNRRGFIKTLALRGSSADYGIYAGASDELYNLGLTSSDLYTNFHLYKNTYHLLPYLKNIVLIWHVFVPGYSLIKTKERYRLVAYKYFFGIEYEEKEEINPKIEKKILKKCQKLSIKNPEIEYQGYEKKINFSTHISAEERVLSHVRENRREPDQMIWVKKMSDLAKLNGHRLFIVIPPFRKDYKEVLPPFNELFQKIYAGDLEAEIVNFYDSPLFCDDDMGDTDHLNEKGAKKLTYELLKIINK